jgi:hypothetical protein
VSSVFYFFLFACFAYFAGSFQAEKENTSHDHPRLKEISQRIEKPNGYDYVFAEMSLSVGFFYPLENIYE